MNNKMMISLLLIGIYFLVSCKTSQNIVEAPLLEERFLDTLFITDTALEEGEETVFELPTYQGSSLRQYDLLHTRLDLSFDWPNQLVLGKATLLLRPYFYDNDVLNLDAKNFDIHTISLNGTALKYAYDNQVVTIFLDKTYTRKDSFEIQINYTAKPNEGPSGGSAAITSDKGLFFINPLNDHKNKPQQIWTQGETQNNSRWFPTIDSPNERCSQEIFITVEQRFQTLSNGTMLDSKLNPDGTRTDYWKQEKPHAPYLFMLGIGEYSIVKDKWKNVPLYYYVEPAFEEHAKKIFDHTPEMINFFSDKLNYPYPWDKYAQIVCRDYVSGAMENTGAVIFGEFVQKTTRELLDGDNDDIVAHELFHHWFGDLVTCESWSNLTLNEGFATYSEYLWQEYKQGKDAAEHKRLQDLNGYLMSSAQSGIHDLIDFEYENREDMFDAHSYNKGGLIVHMLRSYVGDDAFFSALNLYLERHAFTDVEAHELRLAFEDTTGEDLNWFFNQWFYNQGHPILEVNYEINEDERKVFIDVQQIQDPSDNPAIFVLPVTTAIYYPSGKKEYLDIVMDKREQGFEIEIDGDEMPDAVVFDGTHDLLAVINENRSDESYFNLFLRSDEYEDKYMALKLLKGNSNLTAVFAKALKDESAQIRSMAISNVDVDIYTSALQNIALDDSYSINRAKALKVLKDFDLAEKAISKDKSYKVIETALDIILRKNPAKALEYAAELRKDYYKPLTLKLSEIYAVSKDPEFLSFFEENLEQIDRFQFFAFVGNYEKLARQASFQELVRTSLILQSMAMDDSSNYFKKYACTNLINNLLSGLKASNDKKSDVAYTETLQQLEEIMIEIISTTNDERLKSSFQKFNTP